jgi:putative nucleotidyltransferase with HDIG domain
MQLIPPLGDKHKVRSRLTADYVTASYVTFLALIAAGLGFLLVQQEAELGNPFTVAALAVVAACAERGSVKFSVSTEQSISLLPTLYAAVLFGPLPAAIVGAASMLGDPELFAKAAPGRAPRMKWAAYTSTRFIGGAVSGLIAVEAAGLVSGDFGAIVLASLAAAVVGAGTDVAFALLTAKVRGQRLWDVARTLAPLVYASAPVYAPVVAILVVAYETLSPWTAPLFFAPALAAQRLFTLYQHERRLAEDLATANTRLERANLSFAAALIATLDARDRYTAGHSAAVAVYSRDIAARMGMSIEDQMKVHLCGLVHDIGKIGLPAGLLEKAGPLTLDERRQMQEHPAIGERILAKVEDYSDIARIVRHHHERVDGHGYPDALESEEIPLLSRIIAVADAYNAMTSDRPYRDAMPSRVARLRLAQAVETQFDTSVVAAFEAILASNDEAYRTGTRSDFRVSFDEHEQRASLRPAVSPSAVAAS